MSVGFAKVATQALAKEKLHRPVAIIDEQSFLKNLNWISKNIKNHQLRIVTKSLPNRGLLRFLSEHFQCHRFMEFHGPFLIELFETFPNQQLDILMGKPMPIEVVAELFTKYPQFRKRLLTEVQWLVDSTETALELRALHKELALESPLLWNLEVDVGLGRGGFADSQSLKEFLSKLETPGQTHQFLIRGLMGYDGHLGLGPKFLQGWEFRKILKKYWDFRKTLESFLEKPFLTKDLCFNGAGSRTFWRYGAQASSPLNDVAIGSVFLLPYHFRNISESLVPCFFIAAPVLKSFDQVSFPFLGRSLSRLVQVFGIAGGRSHGFLYGGNWGPVWAPTCFRSGLFYRQCPNKNLLVNQELISGLNVEGKTTGLERGQWVFQWPGEGDILFNFNELVMVSSEKCTFLAPCVRRF